MTMKKGRLEKAVLYVRALKKVSANAESFSHSRIARETGFSEMRLIHLEQDGILKTIGKAGGRNGTKIRWKFVGTDADAATRVLDIYSGIMKEKAQSKQKVSITTETPSTPVPQDLKIKRTRKPRTLRTDIPVVNYDTYKSWSLRIFGRELLSVQRSK